MGVRRRMAAVSGNHGGMRYGEIRIYTSTNVNALDTGPISLLIIERLGNYHFG